ncbi:MAG: SDR family NAD(P)-dependent oxidoreductase [Clostridia bacterium]|nr:SDR family NAD(P)-dependent oxidoreductase [Clostridia bacterium]
MEKYTLITGACGGLGKAFVKECAKNGENLFLTGTNDKKLAALLNELKEELSGVKVKTMNLNLGSRESRENLFTYLNAGAIKINKLINNAGVIIEGDTEKFSDEEILNAVEVNCVGTLDLTKKLLRIRNEEEKFEVLTVASVAGFYPIPHMAVYAATKAFLLSMMTSLSIEFKHKNVVITTLCPGGMATNPEMIESIKSMGLGGKLSTLSVEKVAKIGLKALSKKKRIVVAGKFNKFLVCAGGLLSTNSRAKKAGKIYQKSQQKRGF